jgi:hypothetical protein
MGMRGSASGSRLSGFATGAARSKTGITSGVVVPLIAKAIGEQDHEAVHDMLKAEFNYEILVIGDKEMRKPKSTAKMETVEFSEYMEKVRMWAAKFLELYVPDPNEAIG